MKAIGYDVLVDADVDYGDDLNGFMRRATDCRHVLLVVDENYVHRADTLPDSGVGIENEWFSRVHERKPATWLSVLFKDNPDFRLPAWLVSHNPKGHSFSSDPARGDFPGSEQVEELWRWIEDLPANRAHAVSAATLRERARCLEEIDRQRDPNSWSNPALEGELFFEFEKSPGKAFLLGYGDLGFKFQVPGHGGGSVYVYRDPIHAVGVNRSSGSSHAELAAQLTPGRYVVAKVGDQVILQNTQGALCLVDLLEVQREVTAPTFVPASVRFRYRILVNS